MLCPTHTQTPCYISEAKEAKEAAVAAAATTEELELELEALDIAEDPLELEGPEETENEELAKKLLDEQGSHTTLIRAPAVLTGGRCLQIPTSSNTIGRSKRAGKINYYFLLFKLTTSKLELSRFLFLTTLPCISNRECYML